ncbi:Dabb family protein [uncultured Citricoccus sp.]|uniref:Dabb family protein n=1 Tax=uncultured Citricoccus sp. TaxID=614031 RepID=UPI00262ACE95|nr:Dabb family protein [uncultured Citricoccus sp.]
MIRHIFMWQVAESAKNSEVLDLLGQLSDRLTMINSWEVGGHQGEPNENGEPWDGALITDFATWEDLEAYSTDPFHEEIVGQLLPMVRSRAVVDFVREEGRK